MQTYRQFKQASVTSDAIIGEALSGPTITNGGAPLGLLAAVAIPPVRRHRKKMVDTVGFPKEIAQQFGPAVATGVPLGLAMGMMNDPSADQQTALGIIGASIAAHIGGGLLAAVTPTWTDKDMKSYRDSGLATAADMLIPGAGLYHRMKSVGYVRSKAKAKEDKQKKKTNADNK